MNSLEFLQMIFNFVTIIIAFSSVILLIRQTNQLGKTLKSQVYQGLIENSLKIDLLIIDNPEINDYLYGKKKIIKTMKNYGKIIAMIDFIIDIIDNIKVQEKYIPKQAIPGWKSYTNEMLNLPGIKYYLGYRKNWYSGTLK